LKAKSLMLIAVLPAALTLSGCDQAKKLFGGGKVDGQVVATVNGEEITALQLRQEMNGFSSRDPKIVKAAQQQALQQIIMRRLIVQKAKADKLNKSVDFNLQVERGEEGLLAQSYERKIASTTAVPTRGDAEKLISDNPLRFAQRHVFVVDQILAPTTKLDPAKLKAIKTLEEVKQLFDAQSTPYQENVSTLDSLTADSRLVAQIDKLPSGEVFIAPQRGAVIFNRVALVRQLPFRGDPAVAYATNTLRNQRAQDAVRLRMETIRKDAEPKIVYNAAYKPAPAPAPAKPAAAAAAPAAAQPPAAAPAP
jgi:peptidyl-prolyl cis-trans isomerase C